MSLTGDSGDSSIANRTFTVTLMRANILNKTDRANVLIHVAPIAPVSSSANCGGLMQRSYTTSLTFNLSPLTMSSSMAMNCGISQGQLMNRPASQSRFSMVRKTTVSADSCGVSTSTIRGLASAHSRISELLKEEVPVFSSSEISPTISVSTLPGCIQYAKSPLSPYSAQRNSVNRNNASLVV